jgi:hypothetical protein
MAKKDIPAKIRKIYNLANNWTRKQWEFVNQKGYEFAHDEQLGHDEKKLLEEQGMPTFTINRIMPVVEMLNFYATAKDPRWQAIGAEGSDSDLAAVISDLHDYIWHLSNGSTLYANAVNDAICKGVGYLLVTVDPNLDNGMGEVVLQQPEPFDVYVDPKSRDMLFKDAAFIIIRKVLPKTHLKKLYPEHQRKINAASSEEAEQSLSKRSIGDEEHKLFMHNDDTEINSISIDKDGGIDDLVEFFEMYEKVKVQYVNVFYQIPPDGKQLDAIQRQAEQQISSMREEMTVQIKEQEAQMTQAVQEGQMLPERFKLEMKKAKEMMEAQIQSAQQELMSALVAQSSVVENTIMSKKEFKLFQSNESLSKNIVEVIDFYADRIKLTCVAGDRLLYERILPEAIKEYPIIPFHFKWTGTPYPMSAVSPLVGKQQEINKAHQIMVHNASLGSSLRWMFEEGSIDAELWEKYSASPGALLPVRPGVERPTPIMPAPLSNAFFSIVQQGKGDMEYLAGIYSSMMGDTQGASETYRGMLALDEYGTRRIKQWMKNSIEPALKQLGQTVHEYSQAVYTANKRFRIVQPSAIQEERNVEVNIPIYNDMGEAIGKSMDLQSAKYDIRIVAGSTLPVNRWAYLEELKQLMQLGVVDDIAVLAETDIKNKEKIAERKSLYSQLQGQIQQLSEVMKDKEGTIETLERQLVQAGIKGKVMQAEMEINKKKEEVKGGIQGQYTETEAKQKLLRNVMANNADNAKKQMGDSVKNFQKDLESSKEKE